MSKGYLKTCFQFFPSSNCRSEWVRSEEWWQQYSPICIHLRILQVYLHNQYPSPSVPHWELFGVYLRDWWADLRVCLYLNLPQFYLIRLQFELSGDGGSGFLNLCPQVKMDVDVFILPPLIDHLQQVPLSVSIFSLNKRSRSIKV